MNIEERIAKHRWMAEAYRDAYAGKRLQEGGKYGFKFADEGVVVTPYFQDEVLKVASFKMASVSGSATEIFDKGAVMEAKAYCLSFPDWKVLEFKCYPSDSGFAMRVLFEGHTKNATKKDGTKIKDDTKVDWHDFIFVDTNDKGEITRWEDYVNDAEIGPFHDIAIHERGPFKGMGFMMAVYRTLQEAGVKV